MAIINEKIKIDNELKELELILHGFRGFFMAQDDGLIKENLFKMLDKSEIVLKRAIENNKS